MERNALAVRLCLAACLALTACVAPAQQRTARAPVAAPVYKVGDPFRAGPVWTYPREEWAYDATGLATVDATPSRPRLTDNGEVYDPALMTAAHPTLQMPAIVRVTNLANGRTVAVRINDRGPPTAGRLISLTPAAADLLGVRAGEPAPVRVTLMPDESRFVAAAARRLPASGEVAPAAAPRPSVEIDGRAAQAQPERRPLSAPGSIAGAVVPDGRFVPAPVVEEVPPARPPWIFVEAGQYDRFTDANRLRAQLSGPWRSEVRQFAVGKSPMFTVRLGPLSSVIDADGILLHTIAQGQSNARIVVD